MRRAALLSLAVLLLPLACATARSRPAGVPVVVAHQDRDAAWRAAVRAVASTGLEVSVSDSDAGIISTKWLVTDAASGSRRQVMYVVRVTDASVEVDSKVEMCSALVGGCRPLDNVTSEERGREEAILEQLRGELAPR